jgi:hypothetical protein
MSPPPPPPHSAAVAPTHPRVRRAQELHQHPAPRGPGSSGLSWAQASPRSPPQAPGGSCSCLRGMFATANGERGFVRYRARAGSPCAGVARLGAVPFSDGAGAGEGADRLGGRGGPRGVCGDGKFPRPPSAAGSGSGGSLGISSHPDALARPRPRPRPVTGSYVSSIAQCIQGEHWPRMIAVAVVVRGKPNRDRGRRRRTLGLQRGSIQYRPDPRPSRDSSAHPIPSHPIASHPIPSHPIASHPIPSHPIQSPTNRHACTCSRSMRANRSSSRRAFSAARWASASWRAQTTCQIRCNVSPQ